VTTISPTDLERYLRGVRDRQAILDFSIFQEGDERDFASVPLDRFYVPLRLAGRPPSDEAAAAEPAARRQQERRHEAESEFSSTALLSPQTWWAGPHRVLLGDAGSGKTTILRHLTGALAQAQLNQDPDLARAQTGAVRSDLIPLFIPLRYFHHYCRNTAPTRSIALGSFFEFLPNYFRQQHDLTLPVDFFRALLHSGQALLALDGFDEVPDAIARRQVIDVIRHLATDSALKRNFIFVSSRVAAYGGQHQLGGSFETLWVQNLNPEERAAQIEQWVRGIERYTERDLDANDILQRMPEGSPLADLAVTPMIVTTLCVVYFYDHRLPEERAQLYRRCIDIMLHEKLRPDEAGQVLAERAGNPAFKRQLLARLAFEMHFHEKDGVNQEQAARWLKDGFKAVEADEDKLAAARSFLDEVTARGTLLQERGGLFGFGRQHLTFREFLAGYHLILGHRPRDRAKLWPKLAPDDRWREPIRLAAGATVREATLTCEDYLQELLDLANQTTDAPATRLAGYKLAAEALWDLGPKGRMLLDKGLRQKIVTGLAERLKEPVIAAPQANLLTERVAAGQVLGRLSDPREGVTTLPPLLTQPLSGKFQYGDKKKERETAPFQAGVYPITNAQFEQFMLAGGYDELTWWSEAGRAWLKAPPGYRTQPIKEPEYWRDDRFNNPNHPVVGVSYYEAEAFCNWLTATNDEGRTYRLPTEAEWERLARGQQGREYPWGNDWQDGLCNTSEAGLKQTTAVGLFPGGQSPTGAYDCAGNVWEWCADWLDEDEDVRVLRGGSWNVNRNLARCAYRLRGYPDYSDAYSGFRVVSPIS
jgi:formylglycine-generating enzyme required for sulfatase activity